MGPPALDSTALRRTTAILSKRPTAGRVKTRLCPPLDPEQAASLARAMLADAVERCLISRAFRTVLYFTPAADESWFQRHFPGLADLRPQRGAGLAERLAHAFVEGLALPETRTLVAIGSDQPLVATARIESAHRALEDGADLVLGPDRGGGYYLVGQREPHPELFTEVTMSTAGMCVETIRLARARGLDVRLLAPGNDVDVPEDLERLRAELKRMRANGGGAAPDFPRYTEACLFELELDPT